MLIHYPGWIFVEYGIITIAVTSVSMYALGWIFRKKQINIDGSNYSFHMGFNYMDFIIYTEKVICILWI